LAGDGSCKGGPREGAVAEMESEVEGSTALGEDDGWRKGTTTASGSGADWKRICCTRKGARGKKKRHAEKSLPTGITEGWRPRADPPRSRGCGVKFGGLPKIGALVRILLQFVF
jgi:hypothetical protein